MRLKQARVCVGGGGSGQDGVQRSTLFAVFPHNTDSLARAARSQPVVLPQLFFSSDCGQVCSLLGILVLLSSWVLLPYFISVYVCVRGQSML